MPEGPDTRRGKWLLWGLMAVVVLLILFGAALWIWAPLQYLHPAPPDRITVVQAPTTKELPPFVSRLSIQVDELVRSREAIKERLDAISQQASQAQWLLSIVIGVAGLLILAQGLFAFFSAQNYMKQAADAVQSIKDLETEVRSKYPMFSNIDELWKAALSLLAGRAAKLKFTENLFSALIPVERQEIFALENFFAFQFLASADSQPRVIAGLRILGRFYKDKFKIECGRHRGSRSSPEEMQFIRADFERAQYYFTRAVEKSNRADISVLNDLGMLLYTAIEIENGFEIGLFNRGELESFKQDARERFKESLGVCADQQRAPYNLGNTFFDEQDFREALRYFQSAAKAKNWERSPDREMSSYVNYNLACTYSRLSGNETDVGKRDDLFELALKALRESAEAAAPPRSTLDADLASGDLSELAQSSRFSPQLARIRESFERGWATQA
jgi:tetratricopeptide (TPR) repeat protein